MIYINGHTNFAEINFRGKNIVAIYNGERLIWEQVRSCYGKGRWFPEKPWLDNDTWKND